MSNNIRLLSYGIHRQLLDSDGLAPLLRNVRGALFPNNMPGTSSLVAPASDAELAALRRRCARALWALVPKGGVGGAAGRLFFNGRVSTSSDPSFGSRAGPSRGGRTRTAEGARAGAGVGAGLSAVAPQAVTMRDQEGSAQMHQQGHGSAAPTPSPTLSSVEERKKGSRSAPRRSGGDGGQSSPLAAAASPDDGAAATLAQKMTDMGGSTDADTGEDGDEEVLDEIEQSILAVFDDAYCNKHLIYGIVELILVRLLPELADKGVTELWVERLA